LGAVLHHLRETKGWNYGEAWIPDPDQGVLKCSPAWDSNTNHLEKFRRISQGLTFAPGIGLPGRVWSSKQPEWHSDVCLDETIFLRAQMAIEAGIRAGLGIPIIANDQVLAVLVFFMSESRDSDKWLIDTISAVATQLGSVIRRKQLEGQLLHSAFYDPLTGLPNRALFMDRLKQAVEHAKRHQDYLFAVLFLDSDRFKVINDSLGHLLGDQLLSAIALRLKVCLRPTDTVARLGGDEFTILLEDLQEFGDALRIADRVQEQLKLPFNLGGQEIFTSASIGIALSATGYDQPEEILRDADIAMYRAKSTGSARYELFNPDMHAKAVARLQLETDLRNALEC
jgi:diguanylate cyclase (GGDEF)-like protein